MSSLHFDALLSKSGSVQLDALAQFASNLSHTHNPGVEHGFAALLETIACFHPDPDTRKAVISMTFFPQSALPRCLKDVHPNVRKAAVEHPAITTSSVLQHLVYETNERVIIASLAALHNLSDEQALEALGAKNAAAFSRDEFFAVLRESAEHHSHAVRAATIRPITSLLRTKASTRAFTILENLLCDVARVACAAVDAMLEVSHPYRFSERVVRSLASLGDAGEKSALRLLCNVPCKTISGYAFLELYMERRLCNATAENRQEMNDIFTGIVLRNESFARVLDFSRDYQDKQWFWHGEKQDCESGE